MTAKQNTLLSARRWFNAAEEAHAKMVEAYPLYKETAHWTPVMINVEAGAGDGLGSWLEARNLKRGTKEDRHDYLVPLTGLFLFKDKKVAMEFKLTWA